MHLQLLFKYKINECGLKNLGVVWDAAWKRITASLKRRLIHWNIDKENNSTILIQTFTNNVESFEICSV